MQTQRTAGIAAWQLGDQVGEMDTVGKGKANHAPQEGNGRGVLISLFQAFSP